MKAIKLKTKPFPYQEKGIRKIHHFNGRALLADEMGLGKSLQSLAYAYSVKAKRILIICPASLKWNWEREAWTHIGLRCHVLAGRTVPKRFRFQHRVVIVNYDILGSWKEKIRQWKPDLVIIDECHKLQSPNTKQTKNTKAICKGVEKVICLSGTPLLNRPYELFSVLNLLRPDIFKSRAEFAERYCKPQLTPWGWTYKGAENLNELHRRLQRYCMIRRRKAEVLHQLPSQIQNVVPLDIDNRKEYEEALKDLIGWLAKKSPKLANRARRAEQLSRTGYLKRLAATLKLPNTIKWIDNWLAETDEKLIIFGIHKAVLEPLFERYQKIAAFVNGSTTSKKRQAEFDRFNQDKKTRLFIGNLKAAGVGWSCTSTSFTAFVEIGWTPGEHKQAMDRTHGVGRGKKETRCQSYWLVGHNTIEEDLCKLIQKKQRDSSAILDGDELADDLDIFDQLLSIIQKG